MINFDSIEATKRLAFGKHFVLPAYGSYCFAQIPATIQKGLGLKAVGELPEAALPPPMEYQHIILVLVDGLGWRSFAQALENNAFVRYLSDVGVVTRLTAMFPSTTAAHITCLATGLPVAESGVFEWFYYEPRVDQVIAPLLFSPAGEKARELLKQQGIRPEDLYPSTTFYQTLQHNGVKSFSFAPAEYAHSSYNTYVSRGAEIVPYLTWSEALTNLCLMLERTNERAYTFLYFANLDTIAHPYGAEGLHFEHELDLLWLTLERFMGRLRRAAARRPTLLILTADHGMASTDPRTTIYLNQLLPHLSENLRQTRQGEPILFGGSPRDLFLYIREERLYETLASLREALVGKAEVYLTQELVERGVFGVPALSEPLAGRVGNLVVLPYAGESVGWYVQGKFEQKYYGHHGGLTPNEMWIPFVAIPLHAD